MRTACPESGESYLHRFLQRVGVVLEGGLDFSCLGVEAEGDEGAHAIDLAELAVAFHV